jgi:hypothetical protein
LITTHDGFFTGNVGSNESKKNDSRDSTVDTVSYFMSFASYVFLVFFVKGNVNAKFLTVYFFYKNAFSMIQKKKRMFSPVFSIHLSTLIFEFFFCRFSWQHFGYGLSSFEIWLLDFNPITFCFITFIKQFWFVGCIREKLPVCLLTPEELRNPLGCRFPCFLLPSETGFLPMLCFLSEPIMQS